VSYVFCAGQLTVNPDGTVSCDQWESRTEQQVVEGAGLRLSHADYVELSGWVIGMFVVAYGLRIVRHLIEARVLRE
jgi:hypothetical protein